MTNEVCNNKRTRNLHKIIIGQSIALAIICSLAFSVIFITSGYRFDFKKMKLIKTGIVGVEFSPSDAVIIINNEQKIARGFFSQNVNPGQYIIEIEKAGFETWQKTITVEPESVNDFRDIVLFREKPELTELLDQSKIDLITKPTDVLATNAKGKLSFSEHEIWVGEQLVTRFSTPVLKAAWYPDLAHIVYQQGDEIRVIQQDGFYDLLLAKLSSSDPTVYAIGSNGTELYFLDGEEYKVAKIR
jgi:hypothetical protein